MREVPLFEARNGAFLPSRCVLSIKVTCIPPTIILVGGFILSANQSLYEVFCRRIRGIKRVTRKTPCLIKQEKNEKNTPNPLTTPPKFTTFAPHTPGGRGIAALCAAHYTAPPASQALPRGPQRGTSHAINQQQGTLAVVCAAALRRPHHGNNHLKPQQ